MSRKPTDADHRLAERAVEEEMLRREGKLRPKRPARDPKPIPGQIDVFGKVATGSKRVPS